MSTRDYDDFYTCQPNRSDPNSVEDTCTGDDVCGITGFESVECSPDGGCPDVEPAPIFGCVTPLAQDEVCTQQHTHAGFDQCQEGLVCTSAQPPCEDICDENGVCQRHCRPTPASTCQPEAIVTCNPNSDENTCTNGDVCGITGFETIECTPDGGCPAVEPAPYFGCVTPLAQDDICNRQHTYSGFDQCGEGLVCTYGQAPCEEICDERVASDHNCGPTRPYRCTTEPREECDTCSYGNP